MYIHLIWKIQESCWGKETEKQGLRGADLAELTGWSPSKTSKLTAGKQKLTAEDTRIWARALGYTPDPFINEDADIRFYKLDAYIRKPSDALEAYFDASDDSPEHTAIVNYELPLSILSMLGVKLSDYAIRANASYFGIDPYSKKGFGKHSNEYQILAAYYFKRREYDSRIRTLDISRQ